MSKPVPSPAFLPGMGKTDQEVADVAGVSRQTVNGWRNHHPEFIAGLSLRREEVRGVGIDRLRCLLPKALGALERALVADPDPFVLKRGVLFHTGGAFSTVSS